MNIIINESQFKSLIESKMRSWQFIEDVNNIANEIFTNRKDILNNGKWKIYSIGDKYGVKVSNYKTFANEYPENKNAGGFMRNGTVIFYIKEHYTLNDIRALILHELEHAIDYEPESLNNVVNVKQRYIQNAAYSGVRNPQQKNDLEEQSLNFIVRKILYHYWVNTEKNAFIAQTLSSKTPIEDEIQSSINSLKTIEAIDADKHSDFWYKLGFLLKNRTNGASVKSLTPQKIKKHFIRQSYHKIKQYENTVKKKLMYAKMNNLGVVNTSMNKQPKPSKQPPRSSEPKIYYIAVGKTIYGPYTISTMKRFVEERRLIKNSYVWKPGLSTWVRAKQLEDTKSLF